MGEDTRIMVTCGDPAGVGPELIEAWLHAHSEEAKQVTVVGPRSWLAQLPDGCERIAVGPDDFVIHPGKPSIEGGQLALEALQVAAVACRDGQADSVVTAPASKLWLQRAGFKHPGHTEFFEAEWGGEASMAFAGGRMKVVLATWHIPLMDIGKHLTENAIIRAVRSAYYLSVRLGASEPRIAVCGLNPHAGEDGLLGSEEKDFINPLLDRLRAEYVGLSETLPADTVFHRQLKGEFDVVVALYHDQGLAPLKTLEFDSSVNITLGLPYLRCSPDHGTAFSIAGKGVANGSSFANAMSLAKDLCVK